MPSTTAIGMADTDLGDEFDLDVRIQVSMDAHPAEAGFSDWQTCKYCFTYYTCTDFTYSCRGPC